VPELKNNVLFSQREKEQCGDRVDLERGGFFGFFRSQRATVKRTQFRPLSKSSFENNNNHTAKRCVINKSGAEGILKILTDTFGAFLFPQLIAEQSNLLQTG